jgi:hypothetical protein
MLKSVFFDFVKFSIFRPMEDTDRIYGKRRFALFDFVGKDKILYSFRTVVGRINGDDIWMEFPEFIERVQRRKFYRIAPPIGTKIYFEVDSGKYGPVLSI